MKRSNTAFIASIAIHALVALILMNVHKEEAIRQGSKSVAVELNVKAPQPRLGPRKLKIEPIELNPSQRSIDTLYSSQPIRLTTAAQLAKATASRDIVIPAGSGTPFDIGIPGEGIRVGDLFSDGKARSAGRFTRGGKSRLVEFVDKLKGRREIIYCLDVSASMGASNKLNLARNYLKESLFALNEQDTFNIIAFAKDMRIFHEGGSVPATKENLTDAMDFLDGYTFSNISSNTKTDLLSVLIRALEMRPSVIVAVTDGLPTAGVVQPEKIIQAVRERNVDGNTRIFTIGMEMDPELPEAWLMRAIAEQNNGEFQFF